MGSVPTSPVVLQHTLPSTVGRPLGIVAEVTNAQGSTIIGPVGDCRHECQNGVQRLGSRAIKAKVPACTRLVTACTGCAEACAYTS